MMNRFFYVFSRFLFFISIIFGVSVMAAVVGYGNRMVMIWMIVGSVLYWLLVISVILFALIQNAENKYSNIEHLLYAAILLTLGVFGMLKLDTYDINFLIVILVIGISLILGVWVVKVVSQSDLKNGILIAAVIIAWFIDSLLYHAFVMGFILSVIIAQKNRDRFI